MNVPDSFAPFAARLAKVHAEMAQVNADIFICDHAEMLNWLTGFTISETRYRACIVPRDGMPVWVLRSIDLGPCRKSTWIEDIRTFADDVDPFTAIAEVIQSLSGANVKIAADYNSYGFTAHAFATLQSALPTAQWSDLNGISDQIRAVKDTGEIEYMKSAAAIADGAMATLVEAIKPGMRPRDASAIAANYYLKNGAGDWWVGPISISRRGDDHSADLDFLHQTLVDDVLVAGDILHVELVPRVNNYSARLMRSICVGPPSPAMVAVMDRMIVLQDQQIAALQPGAVSGEVDALLRDALLAEKLRDSFDNVTGYQIGLYARTPRSSDFSYCFHPGAAWKIRTGMTFHMYLSAQGLAISESVLVTETGPVRLTQTERGLLSCDQ